MYRNPEFPRRIRFNAILYATLCALCGPCGLSAAPAAAESFLVIHRGADREFQPLSGLDSLAWDSLGSPSASLIVFSAEGALRVPFVGVDSFGFVAAVSGPRLARLTVAAGAAYRTDAPVSAALSGAAALYPPSLLFLEEVKGTVRTPVPVQVAPEFPGEPVRLWFIPPGATPAGAIRTFELSCRRPAAAESLSLDLSSGSLDIRWGSARVLRYNQALVPGSAGSGPEFLRSGFIHPLYAPDGSILSEDSPVDHRHHRGLFLAWVDTRFEGRTVDFWNLGSKQGTVRFTGFGPMARGPVFAGFQAHHRHIDLTQAGGKPALDEDWNVRVWKAGGPQAGYWLWDLTSVQRCASASPVIIIAHYYGGLGLRAAQAWKGTRLALENSSGDTVNGAAARWTSAAGDMDGKWRRVTFLSHPGNPVHPEPSMRFPELSFTGFHPAMTRDWTLEPGKRYVLRYRLLVQSARGSGAEADRAWQDFASPPVTEITNDAAPVPAALPMRVTVTDKAGGKSSLDLPAGQDLVFTADALSGAGRTLRLADTRTIVFASAGVPVWPSVRAGLRRKPSTARVMDAAGRLRPRSEGPGQAPTTPIFAPPGG